MKINGEFVLRQVAGDSILIPVEETALKFNGIITLDKVGGLIWSALEQGAEREAILQQILDRFDVDRERAEQDLDEFLDQMEQAGFLAPPQGLCLMEVTY